MIILSHYELINSRSAAGDREEKLDLVDFYGINELISVLYMIYLATYNPALYSLTLYIIREKYGRGGGRYVDFANIERRF